MRGERSPDRYLDHAAGLAAGRGDRRFRAQRGGRHRIDVLAKLAALRGQRQPLVGAGEQASAELPLQCGDLAADGRMAGAQLARRRGKAALFGHRDEGLAEVPVHRGYPRSFLDNRLFNIVQCRRAVQPYNRSVDRPFRVGPLAPPRSEFPVHQMTAGLKAHLFEETFAMSLPASLKDQLELPVLGSPLFIVSGPELVIAQCRPALSVRSRR